MKKLLIVLLAAMLLPSPISALEYAGVSLPDNYQLGGTSLHLNGQGVRKKFFFSIYVGALYTPTQVATSNQVLNPELPKVIRMHFVYDEVSAEKIRKGFEKSIDNNTSEFSKKADAKTFLNLFNFKAVKNDTVDMEFRPNGTLTVLHNGNSIGRIESTTLCQAVLNIYFGPEPIESLKKGMLGG